MLAPRISLRQLLLAMVFVAAYLALISVAYRGNVVAVGMAISIATLVVVFVFYGLAFWVLFAVASLSARRKPIRPDGNARSRMESES